MGRSSSNNKPRWKIFSNKPPSPSPPPPILENHTHPQNTPSSVPPEFICPISNTIMADPVIIPSGHTFERNCINACISLSVSPPLPDHHIASFTIAIENIVVIPNLALKSTILSWCRHHLIDPPKPIDIRSAEKIVRGLIPISSNILDSESVLEKSSPGRLITRSSCYSSSSSCDIEITSSNILEEDEEKEEERLMIKMTSSIIQEQEEAVITLRKTTRTREETRVRLCTPKIMSALKTLISSRYSSLQVNAVAALVNLSLEKLNKVKIVRSGIVPPLIDVVRGGFVESQDHAAGALFSLSLDDQNKTAIGVLGGLPPLLHALRSESERTRHDSALALYHLSLVQSNRVKMVKLGAVQGLLGMVKTGYMVSWVMMVLCNLAASAEGRAAMLDGGAVECFVCLLSRKEGDTAGTRESCLAAFYGLSCGGLRFKGLAKEAGAEELLRRMEEDETWSEGSRLKARMILKVLTEKHEEDEEMNWEELLNSDEDEDDSSRSEF